MQDQASPRIEAQTGPQTAVLSTPADVAIFGGAAGGGKTYALLLEPLRHITNPRFGAVIFRESYPQIVMEGGLWDDAEELYPLLGATPHKGRMSWDFPLGARVSFAHMSAERDKYKYQGAQIPLIEWDQLEHFSESQFWYMFSRNRSTCGVRPYIRASCNPDPDSFVAGLVSWWIGEDGYPVAERSGVIRWFARMGNRLEWAASRQALVKQFGPDCLPTSLTFIASSVYDNKILLQKDPGYLARLKAMLPVERERLLHGNWKIRPEAGKFIHRDWFEIIDAVPAGPATECRGWDFAATERDLKGPEPAYTAGVKIRRIGQVYVVMDCIDEQVGPAQGDRLFLNRTQADAAQARREGVTFKVRWETEGGSAGKKETARLIRLCAGLDAGGVRPSGDKFTRATPFAVQAQAGNVQVLRGPWNERFLNHLHHQPDVKEKDIMDAAAVAFNELTRGGGSWRG